MAGFGNDLRYALRLAVRDPGFTATAAIVLALAIAANAVAFSFVNSLFLRPLPGIEHPESLVRIYTTYDRGPRYFTVSYPDYEDTRALVQIFSDVVADYPTPLYLSAPGWNDRTWAYIVTTNYFSVLGVRPAIGRFFLPDEGDGRPVVVLSHGFWARRFAADPAVLGQTVVVNGHPFTVIGVAPRGFHGVNVGLKPELWLPEALVPWRTPDREAGAPARRRGRGYFVVGRLRSGVTFEQARAAMRVLSRRLQTDYPASNEGITLTVLPEAEGGVHPMVRGGFVTFSAALSAVVGVVLLLACTNVAGLLLARATARRREVGIRIALGASRVGLIRQLVAESAILWAIAGIAGATLAAIAVNALASIDLPTDRPVFVDVDVDGRVLAFSVVTTLLTGVLFGLLPAVAASRADVIASLKESGRTLGFRAPLRSALVAVQVALCVVLLIAAALCIRSLANAQRIDLGIDPHGVAMASPRPRLQGYDGARATRFFVELVRRLSAMPGVEAVGLANRIPFELNIIRTPVARADARPSTSGGDPVSPRRPDRSTAPATDASTALRADAEHWPSVDWAIVSGGYFDALRIAVREGRRFDARDTPTSPPVAIVNDTLARRLWPNASAVGRRLQAAGATREVVGVVRDGKYLTLGEEPTPFLYLPFEQGGGAETVLVRARASGETTALELLRLELSAMDPTLVSNAKTMREHLTIALIPAGAGAMVLGMFGALALLLASVGLYGLLAYVVAQRTHEIGIRRALGARNAEVIRLVLGHAMSPVLIGLVAGVPLALIVSPLLSALLYGIGPGDPLAYVVAVVTLLCTAMVACGVPARRATRIEPMDALRED